MPDLVVAPRAAAIALPRPVYYAERPDARRGALERIVNDIVGYAVVAQQKSRARALQNIVTLTDALEAEFRELSEDGLIERRRQIAIALRRRPGFPEDLVAEAFALIREISGRLSGRRHYGVQLMGAYAMIRGNLAEMSTGEGKTLTAALAAGVVAMSGIPCHVVTVNDYLASRDADITRPIHGKLGLSVGTVVGGQTPEERRAAYACDITYCTNKELTFDYLRDRIILGQRDSNVRIKVESLRSGTQRHFFFFSDKLWKIYDEHKLVKGGSLGENFAEATKVLTKKYGVAGKLVPADYDKGQPFDEMQWQDKEKTIRAVDRGNILGMVYTDKTVQDNLASYRKNKPEDLHEMDKDVAAATAHPPEEPGKRPPPDTGKTAPKGKAK